jgi:diguanylate cyclase (GGDEF)-like protein
MSSLAETLLSKTRLIEESLRRYEAEPTVERFAEFAVCVNSFGEFLLARSMLALQHASHEVEQAALALFGGDTRHPLPAATLSDLRSRVERLTALAQTQAAALTGVRERRQEAVYGATLPRGQGAILLTETPDAWIPLVRQLAPFGLGVSLSSWEAMPATGEAIALFLADAGRLPAGIRGSRLRALRERFPLARLVCLGVPSDFEALQELLAAGADHCLLQGTPLSVQVERILDLNQRDEEEAGRVLIVEDSRTAGHLIRRTLQENQMVAEIVHDPREALAALRRFNPDLVLMDMYMPGCTGVELTRIIRQHPEFLSVPIVYLSGETDVALQVDALRLGGDHFLTKPFNPVILNAVVRTKIDRYRALRRTMYYDSLTGLLNHTSGKSALDLMLDHLGEQGAPVAVVMMDIDHFKRINDTYGHPAGDQVIRSLAWLLKQRLRRGDVLCRYGGEEFLLALPHTTPAEAHAVIDRIRLDFGQIRHPWGEQYFHATLSGGIAGSPPLAEADALIQAADAALYEAKRSGRNRLCLAHAA